MPLPGTRVIHPQWETHHAPVSVGAMTGEAMVWRNDADGVRNPDTGRTEFGRTLIYHGPVRVQGNSVGGVEMRTAADHNATKGGYLVVVLRDAPPFLVRDVVEIVNVENPMNAVSYTVKNVQRGTLRWETDLGCDLVIPTNAGGGSS